MIVAPLVLAGSTALLTGAGSFVVRGARVFDGIRIVDSASVLVRDGRIAAMGPRVQAPAGAAVVQGAGLTLLPGLIDAHVHVRMPEDLKEALGYGVTTELDMFTIQALATSLKAEQAAGGGSDRADLLSAGTLVTAPGGHGTEYGVPIPTLSGPGEAQAFVDARLAEGSDYVKVVYDDGRAFGITRPTLSRETLEAVIAAAHARKKLAIVHVATRDEARAAIECGADGIAHAYAGKPDAELARLAASRGVFVTPTLVALEGTSRLAAAEGRTAPSLADALAVVRQLASAGVTILAGTDVPNPGTEQGFSLHQELERLVEAGLTAEQALAAATSSPARAYGLADRGRIAAGLRADLVLVEGDPTTDIRTTRRIVGVWKQGVPAKLAAPR